MNSHEQRCSRAPCNLCDLLTALDLVYSLLNCLTIFFVNDQFLTDSLETLFVLCIFVGVPWSFLLPPLYRRLQFCSSSAISVSLNSCEQFRHRGSPVLLVYERIQWPN